MPSQRELIVEHIPRLRRYARALMKNDSLAADDLVQDCLERALSRLHSWRQGSDLRAWLFTIMHNLYVNQVRRASNGPRFVEMPDQGIGASASSAEAGLALRDLSRGVAALPPDQREILLLVSLEGLRYAEVASILGIPEGTVMSRLSRARKQLRNLMLHEANTSLRRVK
ncbi:MAG: RNA polymerase sigma factor [Gammaproteobacteria bacterium]|nr:RNA polymerase sigma factor [Gammaproteobacteria bacterium]